MEFKFLVAQKGAREHYSVPQIFNSMGLLQTFYTDVYNALPQPLHAVLSRMPLNSVRKFCSRRNDALPSGKVRSVPFYNLGNSQGHHPDKLFSQKVLSKIDLHEFNAYFGYTSSSLEIIEAFNNEGKLTILDQYDPGRLEWEIVSKESKEYSQYGSSPPRKEIVYSRAEQEWEFSQKIIVNSEWSKKCLIKQGVDAEKIHTIPLAISLDHMVEKKWDGHQNRPLKIIWLGTANIRKGIHLLIDACRHFKDEIEVGVFGGINVNLERIDLPDNITFFGGVPRSEIYKRYAEYDVFVLPTLSDGFAITQLEAQKMGLPIIASKNCGQVVEQGVNGRLLEEASVDALVSEITWVLNNRERLPEMSGFSQELVKRFDLENFANSLLEMLQSTLERN